MKPSGLLLVAALLTGVAGAYTVKPGDTLYSIARAHGTTVAELTRLNSLSGTEISVGQELRVPGQPISPARPAPVTTPPPAGAKPAPKPVLPAPLPASQLAPPSHCPNRGGQHPRTSEPAHGRGLRGASQRSPGCPGHRALSQ
ncbi:LysM peptidoglycan-binding domain-containing protein [Deinococcus malanensis]